MPDHPAPPDPATHLTPPPDTSSPSNLPDAVQLTGASLFGVGSRMIAVRAATGSGEQGQITLKGLDADQVEPTRDRLRSAISHAGHAWPDDTPVTVTLAPTELPKRAGMLDLPIALSLLALRGAFSPARLDGLWAVGQLDPDGSLRPTPGVLPAIVRACQQDDARTILVPEASLPAAVYAPHGPGVLGAGSLADAVAWLAGTAARPVRVPDRLPYTPMARSGPDLANVTAGPRVRRALEIAAAGGHALLLIERNRLLARFMERAKVLARCLAGLLPDLTWDEALEVAGIGAAIGITDPPMTRPFRAPDDEVPPEALAGGGRLLAPGFLPQAHHGVLFIDQPGQFTPDALSVLGRARRDGWVTVRHGRDSLKLPTRFLLVVASAPVRDPSGSSSASPAVRADLAVEVPLWPHRQPAGESSAGESSATVRARVTAARARQHERGQWLNAEVPVEVLLTQFPHAAAVLRAADDATRGEPGLTVEHLHRLLRVARTIADLDDNDQVSPDHVLGAASFLPGLAPGTQPHTDTPDETDRTAPTDASGEVDVSDPDPS